MTLSPAGSTDRTDLADWSEKVRRGEPRAVARALSEVEDRRPRAENLLRLLYPFSGKSKRLGVTGPPGAGKSTLVSSLVTQLRQQGKSVAVLAVDPTSPFSGGSILGDRIRMQAHHADPGVFIRSMATRGSLGGLAPATLDATVVLEASGRDVVIVETVGVGQAEVDVVKLAGLVSVVLTPGMGDEVQTLKAGVLEIADVFVLNKADHAGIDHLHQQLEAMLAMAPANSDAPAIVRTVATAGQGIGEWLQALDARAGRQDGAPFWSERLLALLRQRLVERVADRFLGEGELRDAAEQVAAGKRNPYEFVDDVVKRAGLS